MSADTGVLSTLMTRHHGNGEGTQHRATDVICETCPWPKRAERNGDRRRSGDILKIVLAAMLGAGLDRGFQMLQDNPTRAQVREMIREESPWALDKKDILRRMEEHEKKDEATERMLDKVRQQSWRTCVSVGESHKTCTLETQP